MGGKTTKGPWPTYKWKRGICVSDKTASGWRREFAVLEREGSHERVGRGGLHAHVHVHGCWMGGCYLYRGVVWGAMVLTSGRPTYCCCRCTVYSMLPLLSCLSSCAAARRSSLSRRPARRNRPCSLRSRRRAVDRQGWCSRRVHEAAPIRWTSKSQDPAQDQSSTVDTACGLDARRPSVTPSRPIFTQHSLDTA